ncbi:MAG: ribonuclease J [Alphaproteobacteria bacterium]|nr:ribonuclease J [Alphaproteobacteria bacterium]
MSADTNRKNGLFWTPRGGNNANDIWASCHTFSSVVENAETGKTEKTTVIVDMGQNEIPRSILGGAYEKVVPALDDCLAVSGCEKPENEAQAVFLTHAHSDHIAGIFEYLHMGVKLPEVYGSDYTIKTLRKELIERGIKREKWPELKTIGAGDKVRIGSMTVEAFAASHSIPGCFSFKISDKNASIFHSGDTKADGSSFLGNGVDMASYDRIGGVDLMTFDATATAMGGHATYESEIFDEYKKLFKENREKQIIAVLPAAHMERLATVISAAQAAGKDVLLNGGASMEKNVMALKLGGYDLQEKCPDICFASANSKKADDIDPKKAITITTGIYGEVNSPFVRKLVGEKSDFVLSDDAVVIAPTYGSPSEKIENLVLEHAPAGVTLIAGKDAKIYGSGHAQADDFVKIAEHVRPTTVIPIHCSRKMAESLNSLAKKCEYRTISEYPYNGTTVSVGRNECRIVSVKEPEWFGINHYHQADGVEKVEFDKCGDYGYSSGKMQDSMKDRQEKAFQKIAAFRRERSLKKIASMLKRGGYGR